MNGIKVFGEFLDLSPQTKVNITLKNPIFADDQIIPGSYSLPLEIPFGTSSPKNTRLLKNLHVVENSVKLREVDAFHFYDGLKFKKGKLIIGKLDPIKNTLEVNFKFGLSNLENVKSLKLRNIVNGSVVLNNNNTYTKKVRLDPLLSSPFNIIVNGRNYTAANIPGLVTAINNDLTEPRALATNFDTYFTVEPRYDQYNIETPFTVDNEDPREWTVTPNDTLWNQPILDALQDYLQEPYPSNTFRLPTMLNPGQYENGYQFFKTGLINMSSNGLFKENYSAPEGDGIVNFNPFVSQVYTSIAPYVMLKHVMDEIATHYGFEYEGDFYTNEIVQKALIYTPNSITVKVPFIGKLPFFFFRQNFNLGEFVPDITVSEFFKALQTKFCLSVNYKANQNRLLIRFRKAVFNANAYKDITAKCSSMLAKEDIGLKGIKLQIERDLSDAYCPQDEVLIGTEQEETIPSKCYGLAERQDLVHTLRDIPAVNQLFSDKPYSLLRLFFYEGIENAGDFFAFEYPKASALLPDGSSLTFQGSAYSKWWTEYLYFKMNRQKVDVQSEFGFAALNDIDWEQKVMFDRVKYLFDEISFSFSMDPNKPANAETSLFTT